MARQKVYSEQEQNLRDARDAFKRKEIVIVELPDGRRDFVNRFCRHDGAYGVECLSGTFFKFKGFSSFTDIRKAQDFLFSAKPRDLSGENAEARSAA